MDIATITSTSLGIIVSLALFLYGKVKDKKSSRLQASLQDDNAKYQILSKVSEFCCEAEQVVGKGNGPLKELYVTCRVDKMAHEKGVIITQEEIKSEIEKVLTAPQKKV